MVGGLVRDGYLIDSKSRNVAEQLNLALLDIKSCDSFWRKCGNKLRQMTVGVKRADDKRTAVGEYPTVAHGGGGDGRTIAGNRRDDQQSVCIHCIVEFVWHGFPWFSCQNKNDGNIPAKKEFEDVLFKRTLKTADDAMVRIADLRRPIIAFQDGRRRYFSRRQKRHFVRTFKKRRVANCLECRHCHIE